MLSTDPHCAFKLWAARRRNVALLAMMSLALVPTTLQSKDYGTVGQTWAIAEPDLLAVIRAQLLAAKRDGRLDAINRQFEENAQKRVNRPVPLNGITPARTDRAWSYDPTVTVSDDIRDSKGNLIAAKGQRFNPLHLIGMTHSFAFVDGDNASEVSWAMRQGPPEKLWIVMVKGSPIERMKQFKRRFYFDQQGVMTGKFGIEHTPALVTQAGDRLDLREVALKPEGPAQ